MELRKPTLEKFLPNPKLKLREQLAEVMRFRHFSHRTVSAYWHWIKGFILFHQKRHPREMHAPEVRAYLSHLASVPILQQMRRESPGPGVRSPLDAR